jgi:hypothetical protein
VANLVQKANIAFVKGLITEAGELTFPENASVDELNCDLNRDGTRRRRKGIRYETGANFSSFSVDPASVVSYGDWLNVGNDANKNYLVIQVNSTLHFYVKAVLPYSARELPDKVDLLQFEVPGSLGAGAEKCSFTSILGNLVVVSPSIEPFFIQETPTGFVATKINCRIRDFEWLGDRSTYTVRESNPSRERKYDTANSGWVRANGTAALQQYIVQRGGWPPLTHPWYSGKDSNGNFTVTEWEKVFSGSSLLGNGHFVLNLFAKNRGEAAASFGTGTFGDGFNGVVTGNPLVDPVPTEFEHSRFRAVTSFAGRVFFSGLTSAKNSGKIYFSRTLENMNDVGEFYQVNDPTAEEISDLLDTDGGVISIPDAVSIRVLYAFRNSVFVFGENGVWQIKGVDDVFSPTAFSVNRVSAIGLLSSESFVAAEGIPFWWSRYGIHTLRFDEFGNAQEENLSMGTIQRFWNRISAQSKQTVKAAYDKINKKIYWLYQGDVEPFRNKYNNVLVLDVNLQAFYPWRFKDKETDTPYVLGVSFYQGYGVDNATYRVVDTPGVEVTASGAFVTVELPEPFIDSSSSLVFLVRDPVTDRLTMATLTDEDFLDWETENFISYAETGYDFLGDLASRKYAPYIVFYMRETETGWAGNDIDGYEPLNPSGLLVSCYWDFNKLPSSIPQQVYKRRQPILQGGPTFDSPSTVVSSKIKVRGSGRSLRVRLESEQGKDFVFVGHSLVADVTNKF